MKVKCFECKGVGYYQPKGWPVNVTCCMCGGKKYFDIPEGMSVCETCRGAGKLVVDCGGFEMECTCEDCMGKGYVKKETKIESTMSDEDIP